MILLQQSIKIVSMPQQPVDLWQYFAPILTALFGYLGGLLTPATLERIKFWRISRKLNLTADPRENNYSSINVQNDSHYLIRGASLTFWLNIVPQDIAASYSSTKIGRYSRRQPQGDFLPWALDSSTPLGLRTDFNPGETQRALFAALAYEGTSFLIASEEGLNNQGKITACLLAHPYEGIIKLVSADSFPRYFEISLGKSNRIQLTINSISEANAKSKIDAYSELWGRELEKVIKAEEEAAELEKAGEKAFQKSRLELKKSFEENKDKPSPKVRVLIDNRYSDVTEIELSNFYPSDSNSKRQNISSTTGNAQLLDFFPAGFKHNGISVKYDECREFHDPSNSNKQYIIFCFSETVAGLDAALRFMIVGSRPNDGRNFHLKLGSYALEFYPRD